MTAYKFVGPVAMHPGYQNRIETAMTAFLDQVGAGRMLCHEGPAEVSLALSTPLGQSINGVVVCSCDTPRAALEGGRTEPDQWDFTKLATA